METTKTTTNVEKEKMTQEMEAESFNFIRKIDWVVRTLRECNLGVVSQITKEEKETQVSITRIEFPQEGGCLTYYEGIEYPSKGFPYAETVETVDRVKKMYMLVGRRMMKMLSKNKLKTIVLLLFLRKEFFDIISGYLESLNGSLRLVRQKPQMYCICVRELYRVFGLLAEKYKDKQTQISDIRDTLCMILEYDDAYRYRFQNEISNLNKENVGKDLVKELNRLLDRGIEAEIEIKSGVETRYALIKKTLILLKFKKDIRNMLRDFILDLDIDKLKLDKADKFHANIKGIKCYEEEKEKISKPKDDKLIYKINKVFQKVEYHG
jgi:hypothetical protein